MAQNKQQTALDWFWNEVEGATLARDADFFAQKLQQAKQLEKEQIIDSVFNGLMYCESHKDAEEYYNKTFGK